MKKTILHIICLICCVFLCACGLTDVNIPPIPTATPYVAVTIAPTPTPEPEIIPAGLENRIIIRISDNKPDPYMDPIYGTIPILSFRYQIPTVFIEGNDEAADKINKELNELSSKYYSSEHGSNTEMDKYTELSMLANDNFSEENQIEFKFSRMVTIERADDSIIIFKFVNTTNTFGNENVEEEYHYFDTVNGTELEESLALSDSYPVADKTDSGILTLKELKSGNSDNEIVDLVTIDEEGDEYLLSCDGIVYDLYLGDDWYCNIMNNCSVEFKAKLPEGFPELLISYLADDKVNNVMFIKDPDTGKAGLIDYSEIEIVG